MASRWERRKWPLLAAVAIGVLGVAGTLAFTGTWGVVLSAAMIGFSVRVILTLVLALPALLIAPDDVPRMSAGVFTLGYGFAMTMSILGGITGHQRESDVCVPAGDRLATACGHSDFHDGPFAAPGLNGGLHRIAPPGLMIANPGVPDARSCIDYRLRYCSGGKIL